MNEPHEGLRKNEAMWPVHQINWQKSRYVFDMYYKHEKISKELYDWCLKLKIVDASLAAKWKKPGYERLCSTYNINTRNFNQGTTSICRVPRQSLSQDQTIESQLTGCRGCASGKSGYKNIFGNKYGQYLADIQVTREESIADNSKIWELDDEDDFEGEESAASILMRQAKRQHESSSEADNKRPRNDDDDVDDDVAARIAALKK